MSLTKVSFSLISDASFNVMDYGATGNGVTDDTAAIQAAITEAEKSYNPITYGSDSPANGSSVVFFPSGFYKISEALIVTKKVTFVGEGQTEFSSGSRIYQSNVDADLVSVQPISTGCSFAMQGMVLTHKNVNNRHGSGVLLRATKAAGYCNSQRYVDCVFGQPAYGFAEIIGDDVVFQNCLFDVSYGQGINLGVSEAGKTASNVRFVNCDFFAVHIRAISIYNAINVVLTGCTAYHDVAKTTYFIDAYNTIPYQVKNITISGNSFSQVRNIFSIKNIENFVFSDNSCLDLGKGTGETLSAMSFYGTCSNVVISGNALSGSYDTSNFYDDSSATVSLAALTGNSFVNIGGPGAALKTANTAGSIANNAFSGFATPSVSETFVKTGNFAGGATLAAGNAASVVATVTGAKAYDKVNFAFGTSLPFDTGVANQSYVSAANTATIQYVNPTAVSKNISEHSVSICVTR